MSKELLYRIALTLVPNIGDVHGKNLLQHFESAEAVFHAKKKELERIEGIGEVRAGCIKQFEGFERAEEEIAFIEKFKITPLFITDKNYPQRLLNCYDSPLMLYYRGTGDLNAEKIISVVGTRNNSEYGKKVCEDIINELSKENIIVVSGLAFGIDTIAHKAAVKDNIPTVGVLAHGLDRIYPHQNKLLAKQMLENGGILSDFMSNTLPDRQNFPKRNRIVAGMCDALVVIESGKRGGSLITAELANNYNKDVFAIPGKTIDSKSEGCNYLIKTNKAMLVENADDIMSAMGWKKIEKKVNKQRTLFIELSKEERVIYDLLSQAETLHIDEIYHKSKLSSSSIANALLMLEMQNIIISLPGKMYRLA